MAKQKFGKAGKRERSSSGGSFKLFENGKPGSTRVTPGQKGPKW